MATISFGSMRSGPRKKADSEAEIQKLCWAWLKTQPRVLKTIQDYSYMVPNGTQLAGARDRRAMYMSSLKAQGFRPGVSDIVIALPTYTEGNSYHHGHHGAYIELKKDAEAYGGPKAIKARQNAIRPEQRDWLVQQAVVGYWCCVAWGFEDFKRLVRLFLNRESPPPLDWDARTCDT